MKTFQIQRWTSRYQKLIALLAFLFVLIRSYYFFEYTQPDRHLQTIITHHFVEGRGISFVVPDPLDPAQSYVRSSSDWPPAYYLVHAPVYLLLKDYFLSMKVVHLLGIALLMGVLHIFLIGRLSAPAYSGLFMGVTLSFAPLHYPGTTGLWAAAGLFFAIHHLLLYKQKLRVLNIAWAVLGLGIAALFRYAYYPFLLLPVIAVYLISENRHKHLAIAMGLVLICLSGLVVFQLNQAAGSSYFELRPYYPSSSVLYPAHLLAMDIFPLKAFCYLHPPKLSQLLHANPLLIHFMVWTLSFAILFLIGWHLKKNASYKLPFNWLLLVIMLLNIGPLLLLSLAVPAEVAGENGFWTYVQEGRYYFPTMLVLQIWMWQMVTETGKCMPGKAVSRALLLLFIIFGGAHSFARLYEYVVLGEKRSATASVVEHQLIKLHEEAVAITGQNKKLLYIYGKRDPLLATRMAVESGGALSLPWQKWGAESSRVSDTLTIWLDLTPEEYGHIPPGLSGYMTPRFVFSGGIIYEGILTP